MSLSPEELQMRSKGIGASEAGAVIGASRWRTPIDVWLVKTGQAPASEATVLTPMWWGHQLEAPVAAAYAQKHGVKLRQRKTIVSKKYPMLLATLDREVVGQRRTLEIKTSTPWYKEWGEGNSDDESSDNCPYEVICQVMQQMFCRQWTDNPTTVALFKTITDYREYTVHFDEDLWEYMLPKLLHFWTLVETREPPVAINIADINTLYPEVDDNPLLATDELLESVRQYDIEQANFKRLEMSVKAMKEQLILAIGPHDVVNDEGGRKVYSYKNIKTRTKIDWEQVTLSLFQHMVDRNLLLPDDSILGALKEKHSTIAGGYRRWYRKAPALLL